MQETQYRTLIVVPTLDLMHQWYAHLLAAFPDTPLGVLGGSERGGALPAKFHPRRILEPTAWAAHRASPGR
jgi:hypothetical protein